MLIFTSIVFKLFYHVYNIVIMLSIVYTVYDFAWLVLCYVCDCCYVYVMFVICCTYLMFMIVN